MRENRFVLFKGWRGFTIDAEMFYCVLGDWRNEYSIPAGLPNPKWGNLNERAFPKGEGNRIVESEYIYSLSDYSFFFFCGPLEAHCHWGD